MFRQTAMNLYWRHPLADELPQFVCGKLAIGALMAVAYLEGLSPMFPSRIDW